MKPNDFLTKVCRLVAEYREKYGNEPNELHIGQEIDKDDYLECIENHNRRPDVHGRRKHFWFMGMRVFYSIRVTHVRSSKETAKIISRHWSKIKRLYK